MVAEVAKLRAAGKPSVPSLLSNEMVANPFLTAPDVASFADARAKKDKF
jgi:hydroxyacylglutathione hydrolase